MSALAILRSLRKRLDVEIHKRIKKTFEPTVLLRCEDRRHNMVTSLFIGL
jgi:hypothetical protein